MSVSLELLWSLINVIVRRKGNSRGLLDEHFSGTGTESSLFCLLCLVLRAVAITARITTKQATVFIPHWTVLPTAQNIIQSEIEKY